SFVKGDWGKLEGIPRGRCCGERTWLPEISSGNRAATSEDVAAQPFLTSVGLAAADGRAIRLQAGG
ncbi:MAG: hypothetical protein ACR2O8_03510, partial [Rhizobiaceae bacterium]